MAEDPRRFDSIERTVRDTRRKLDDVQSTVMARLATHSHAGGGGGAVDSVNGQTGAVVLDAADVGAQPADADLSTIAGLAPADGQLLRRVAGAWASSTLTKADVGLGSVDNVSAANLRDRSTHTGSQAISTLTATGTPDATTFLRGDGAWAQPPAGGGGGAVDSVNGQTGVVVLDAADVGAAATVHSHDGGDIATGTVPFARLPVGSSGTQVASGAHSHAGVYATTSHTHDPMDLVGSVRQTARYYATTTQSIATGGSNKLIAFGTTGESSSAVSSTAIETGHRFTINVPGVWVITTTIRYGAGGGAGERYAAILHDSFDGVTMTVVAANASYAEGQAATLNIAWTGYLRSATWVRVEAWQGAVSSINLDAALQWVSVNFALIRRST